ncbi:triose-phosphate isomerase [Sulfurospirillum arcachonense]|uniref:triose-phosphate isomerase n=1 Tax=Sulfurospirillum arcachonense TaxID=57666 RepID=UPI00046A1207|nr:triose-phosphate isomerase [Sulfurospirillum arcachonense]
MIIASNFKTNHTRKSTKEFVLKVENFVQQNNLDVEVRIYPTATALDKFDVNKTIKVGAQNFYPTYNGSFTGEVGFEQLEEFGVDTVLIGHSERRHVLKESNELTAQKYNFAKEQNLEIVYCVGEPKEVRVAGIDAVMAYVWEQFAGIDLDYKKLVVAYEPVWAIGTGLTASDDDIKEVLQRLREKITKPLLYGGSVKVDNVGDILKIQNCNGVLVGTASWEAEDFCKMIEAAKK